MPGFHRGEKNNAGVTLYNNVNKQWCPKRWGGFELYFYFFYHCRGSPSRKSPTDGSVVARAFLRFMASSRQHRPLHSLLCRVCLQHSVVLLVHAMAVTCRVAEDKDNMPVFPSDSFHYVTLHKTNDQSSRPDVPVTIRHPPTAESGYFQADPM